MTTFQRTHLAVFIDVIFEVIVFSNDSFGDEWLVEDTNCGQQGGAVGLSQPCDLSGFLVVLVVQVQASLHGHNLSISPSEECEGTGQKVAALLFKNFSIFQNFPVSVLVDLGDDEVPPVDEGDHLSL